MKMRKTVALVAAALVLGLVVGNVASGFAAPTTRPATSTVAPERLGLRLGPAMRDAGGRLIDVVAKLTGLTADEVADPQNLKLWLEVDGVMRQNGTTKTMVFGVAHLVSYCSRFMSLQPGDVISTGTPPGVGMGQKPTAIYLNGGEVMRLGIEGLGVQTQKVVRT